MKRLTNSRNLLILFLLIPLGAIAWADDVTANSKAENLKRQAAQYYFGSDDTDRNYTRALELYEAAAELGDIEANYIAGGMYYTGKGTTRNFSKAYNYLDYAAKNGKRSPESDRALAEFYLLGQVVPQNYDKAVSWYKKAAEGGDPNAQLELGYLYYTGQGTEQDYQQALRYFRESAMKNFAMAQYNMGIMWYTGIGTEQSDLVRSYAWFSIAASNDYQDALAARDFLGSRMSLEELDAAQKVAWKIYQEMKDSNQ
ncbi:MAG: sel1 repeat family protein [Desulfobulbaceae bacterium]|nr:MAG: sel1 repeat family protein [Desulfobulbaceae bacterium]